MVPPPTTRSNFCLFFLTSIFFCCSAFWVTSSVVPAAAQSTETCRSLFTFVRDSNSGDGYPAEGCQTVALSSNGAGEGSMFRLGFEGCNFEGTLTVQGANGKTMAVTSDQCDNEGSAFNFNSDEIFVVPASGELAVTLQLEAPGSYIVKSFGKPSTEPGTTTSSTTTTTTKPVNPPPNNLSEPEATETPPLIDTPSADAAATTIANGSTPELATPDGDAESETNWEAIGVFVGLAALAVAIAELFRRR